jgi:hypothetical protein
MLGSGHQVLLGLLWWDGPVGMLSIHIHEYANWWPGPDTGMPKRLVSEAAGI